MATGFDCLEHNVTADTFRRERLRSVAGALFEKNAGCPGGLPAQEAMARVADQAVLPPKQPIRHKRICVLLERPQRSTIGQLFEAVQRLPSLLIHQAGHPQKNLSATNGG